MKIPKIIHQIWSGIDEPLPKHFETLGKTWKHHYPDWEYQLWNNERMNTFVVEHYPEYWDRYNKFQYNIQRWDVIRYLILNKIGGLYADFDYESVKPMTEIIQDKTCCFSQEPVSHHKNGGDKKFIFNNALMLSIPNHFFMDKIIRTVLSKNNINKQCENKAQTVFETTGPYILNQLYNQASNEERSQIYLIPPEFVSPFDHVQSRMYQAGVIDSNLEVTFKDAYAVHYFLGAWIPTEF